MCCRRKKQDGSRFVFSCRTDRPAGFTLLELLLSISILAVLTGISYMSFSVVVDAWKRGTELAANLHHGDYVMDQLVMALRSAYYPETVQASPDYGFSMEDAGGSPDSSDRIRWTKLGNSLVGKDCPFVGSPHRVEFYVEENEEGERFAQVKAWRLQGQPEEFTSEDVVPIFLSGKIHGFNCRTAYRKLEDEIEWMDDWVQTNKLPALMELTLYLAPLGEGEEPVEVKRVIGIPVSGLSWL